jgi:hypothetical protein
LRGRADKENKDVTAIGRGKSQAEADVKALEMLTRFDVTTDEQIVYRYFSYGADLTAYRRPAVKIRRRQAAFIRITASHGLRRDEGKKALDALLSGL